MAAKSVEAKAKLLQTVSNGDIFFEAWRRSSDSKLCKSAMDLPSRLCDADFPRGNFVLLQSKVPIRVLHEFTRCI